MIARGKREARRPWLEKNKFIRALKVRNIYSALSELHGKFYFTQGRRARVARRLPLAIIFRAFGAALGGTSISFPAARPRGSFATHYQLE